jgi:MoaA/NifB/PqqE/SkfB family radical SAM enzyme
MSSLRPLLERLAKLKIRSLSLSSCDAAGRAGLTKALDMAAEFGLPLTWDLPVPYSSFHPADQEEPRQVSAGAGKGWLYVEPDGDVLPEQGVNRVLGNMVRDSWDAIWQHAQPQ